MAFLKIMSGTLAGTKYDIDKDETTIGRLPENVIILNEPAVSSRHCVLIRDGKKFTLRDVGSTNGTRLNEKKVTESRLKPKDIILIGAVEILFDGEDIEVDSDGSREGRTGRSQDRPACACHNRPARACHNRPARACHNRPARAFHDRPDYNTNTDHVPDSNGRYSRAGNHRPGPGDWRGGPVRQATRT